MCAVATGSLLGPASEKADNVTLTGTKDGATAAGAFMLPILIEEVLQSGAATGYPLTRLLAHMKWALLDKPGVEEIGVVDERAGPASLVRGNE